VDTGTPQGFTLQFVYWGSRPGKQGQAITFHNKNVSSYLRLTIVQPKYKFYSHMKSSIKFPWVTHGRQHSLMEGDCEYNE